MQKLNSLKVHLDKTQRSYFIPHEQTSELLKAPVSIGTDLPIRLIFL